VELIGFKDGVRGLIESRYIPILRETYANFNNLGGYDYLGRGADSLRIKQELESTLETCRKLGLSGLVLVGATATLTDAVYLANYLNEEKCGTRVIVIPASVDGNIHHKYVQTAIGFDTCSKFYSQLIGNMLTDSASAIKYWYFIRLMGNQPSHMALECALKTCPNMVLISEETVDRKETLRDIVNNICEVIIDRARDNKNYGAILIPEGLISQIASFDQMIIELNQVFSQA
jgi:diphosphate--fructose-6-phosphate 1-phosphotransferase